MRGRARDLGPLEHRLADPEDIARGEGPLGVDAIAIHERPVRRAEILDRELAVGSPVDPGVAARDLGIVAELSLLLGSRATDQQLGLDGQALASLLALGHLQLLA